MDAGMACSLSRRWMTQSGEKSIASGACPVGKEGGRTWTRHRHDGTFLQIE
jgi:hypothetical protein